MGDGGLIIVTGADGFVGQRLVKFLRSAGREVFSWTRQKGDLCDGEAVNSGLKELRPSLIFHLAAQPVGSGVASWAAPAKETEMITNLAAAMPTHCRLISTGSMAEYGYSGYFDELALCKPTTAYGFSKLASTNQALAMRVNHGLDIKVARLFGVFGPGENQSRLFPYMISQLRSGKSVDLSDGKQIRDFIHIDDVCSILSAYAENDNDQLPLLNVGTGVGVTVRHVCEAVAKELAVDVSLLRFGVKPRRIVDEDCLVAKIKRLSSLTTEPPQRWLSSDAISDYIEEMSLG